jgi:Tfp pilus assembly protein PilW
MELMVAMGLSVLTLSMVAPFVLYSGKSFAAMANYADMNTVALNTIDRMTKEIRQTSGLTSFATNQIVLDDGTNGPLTYAFSTATRTLSRVQGGASTVLLRDVDSGEFAMYQRTTISNSYQQYVATAAAACKLIDVKWTCSRLVFGLKINTEIGQSARIVIRKN